MNDKDKEAFEKWFISCRDSSFAVFLRENYPDAGIKWNREPARSAWQAACKYKQKEIDSTDCYIERDEKIKKLQDENAKLRAVVMLASEACCYTDYEDACSLASKVLKELENK